MTEKVAVSVLIPTKNEAGVIAACIGRVAWADEIIVFDSESTDDTRRLAEAAGARVVTRPFDTFATHKNWALDHIDFRNDWVLIVDADEQVTSALRDDIAGAVADPRGCVGFYVRRKNYFQGRWLRFLGMWPDWNMRLVRRGRARYEPRIVHEHMVVDGKAGYLDAPLVHYDYKGMERYIDRHNVYSSMEAVELYRAIRHPGQGGQIRPDWRRPGPARRRFLKTLAYRYVPARPIFVFVWMYVFRLGFLLGWVGFRYAALHMFYQYQIDLKYREILDPTSDMRRTYGRYFEAEND